jgi:hypothetical protein
VDLRTQRQQRKTLVATYGGWPVDAFDFMIHTFASTLGIYLHLCVLPRHCAERCSFL